jgi:uncharacterized protein involved in exopolysaccharide biosynthesis
MSEADPRKMSGRPAPELTLRDVLVPVFRHKRVLTHCFLIIFSGAVVCALFVPQNYEAHMKILVKRERMDPVVTTEATTQMVQPAPAVTEEELHSEAELLRSRDLLENVVLASHLQEQKKSLSALLSPNESAEARLSEAVNELAKKLQIRALAKTNLIEVGYESTNPQTACQVLTTLAALYTDKHLAVHRPRGAFDFFQRETEQYEKNLKDAETRLARFGREQKVASPQVERDLILQKLSDFEATAHQTEAGIVEAQHRISNLEAQLNDTPPRLNTTEKAADNAPSLEVLEGTLSSLELKHTDMAAHFEPDYRPRRDLEAQIAQVRARIAEVRSAPLREHSSDVNPAYLWLTQELARSRSELVALQAKSAAITRDVQLYRQSALGLGQKQIEEEDLLRNAKAQEGNFLLYLNKREEARISDALDSQRIVNVAIAETATVPALPTHSPWLIVVLGAFLAGIVAILTAFALDYLDQTLRTKEEVERVLEIPVLAVMPKTS